MSDKTERQIAFEMALSMYANEPCRICRRLLTIDDLRDGAVFAGYSADNTARAAHRVCWQNAQEVMGRDGVPDHIRSVLHAALIVYITECREIDDPDGETMARKAQNWLDSQRPQGQQREDSDDE